MLKPFRGQAELVAGEKSYRLYLDNNRLMDLEKLIGHPLPRILEMLNQSYMHIIRGVLWMAALKHQPETTEDEMGDALFAAGEGELMRALKALFIEVMPAKEAAGEGGENPPTPGATPAGTGTGSTPSGANRASRRAASASKPRARSSSRSTATKRSAGAKAT